MKTRRVEHRPHPTGSLSQDGGHAGQTAQQLRVLLVEDNLINQQVLGRQLKKAGCLVEVANHGLEALNYLKIESFDVVLMDLEMLILNGIDAMKEIWRRERDGEDLLGLRTGARLPIVAITANAKQEQIDNTWNRLSNATY